MRARRYSETFRNVLRLFPELTRYNVIFETYESKPGFSVGEVRRRGNFFVVRLAANLVEDEVDASFVIAHELAHILVNSHGVPVEGEVWKPGGDCEELDRSIEDVICDWIALKRLEQHYKGDKEKLKRLYEVYLSRVGPAGYVALAEDMKDRVLQSLKEKHSDHMQEVMKKYFMNMPIDVLGNVSPFAALALFKYLKITTN